MRRMVCLSSDCGGRLLERFHTCGVPLVVSHLRCATALERFHTRRCAVTGLRTGMSFGAVSHLRCAVSGFTPAVCHGFGAVSHQAVCRDGVADRHVLWSGFTPAVCR
jgi:hypothetical protein